MPVTLLTLSSIKADEVADYLQRRFGSLCAVIDVGHCETLVELHTALVHSNALPSYSSPNWDSIQECFLEVSDPQVAVVVLQLGAAGRFLAGSNKDRDCWLRLLRQMSSTGLVTCTNEDINCTMFIICISISNP